MSNLEHNDIAIYTSKVKEPTINIKEIEISKMVLNIKKNPIFIFGFEDVKMQSIQKVKIPVSYKKKNENTKAK